MDLPLRMNLVAESHHFYLTTEAIRFTHSFTESLRYAQRARRNFSSKAKLEL
jgi:hypothetical protein